MVWDVLTAADRHLSAAEIADEARQRDPQINVSSVYRTLSLFADLGLVRESRLGDDSASTWERAHGDGVIHLVCVDCGAVVHHDAAVVTRLQRELRGLDDFDAHSIDVRVTGRCSRCRQVG